mmetsp:Transcript_8666/g.22162  ORF Transcript_8666/g.22162 Transcript_8666/m.22162 type:complete len:213 (-) Transcript_8666:772-1410(-)
MGIQDAVHRLHGLAQRRRLGIEAAAVAPAILLPRERLHSVQEEVLGFLLLAQFQQSPGHALGLGAGQRVVDTFRGLEQLVRLLEALQGLPVVPLGFFALAGAVWAVDEGLPAYGRLLRHVAQREGALAHGVPDLRPHHEVPGLHVLVKPERLRDRGLRLLDARWRLPLQRRGGLDAAQVPEIEPRGGPADAFLDVDRSLDVAHSLLVLAQAV